jgi:hypothetical protein
MLGISSITNGQSVSSTLGVRPSLRKYTGLRGPAMPPLHPRIPHAKSRGYFDALPRVVPSTFCSFTARAAQRPPR